MNRRRCYFYNLSCSWFTQES